MMRPEDWSGLAPERDRPEHPEFDWQPEALNMTAAAAFVVQMHRISEIAPSASSQQASVLGLWSELCGMDEAAALTYAYSIADAVPPVMGTVPPF